MGLTIIDRNVVLERYFPDVIAPAKEFKELAKAENAEFSRIWAALWKQMLNTFVYDIDHDGAKRWESMLGIFPAPTDTLEERRQAILAKINATLPYTEKRFQEMLDAVYGAGNVKSVLTYDKYELHLDLVQSLSSKVYKIRAWARAIIPANLDITLRAMFELHETRYRVIGLSNKFIVNHTAEIAFNDVVIENGIFIGGFAVEEHDIKPCIQVGKTLCRLIASDISRTVIHYPKGGIL